MTKFRVIVQIYKTILVDAPSALDAKRMAEEEMKASGITDKYNINEAKDLDKAHEKRKEYARKKKEIKTGQNNVDSPNV